MSATPRDLLKTREARRGEVLSLLHLKAGQANSQVVLFGNVISVGTASDTFDVSDGEYVLAQAVVEADASTANEVDAGAATSAGQFRKVLIERNASGAVSQKVGAVASSQADAELPAGDTDKVSIGWIEVPASFTPGTTALTAGMLKQMPYWGEEE